MAFQAPTFPQVRDSTALILGTVGFLHQVFLEDSPNYLIVGASIGLIFGIPIFRLDDRKGAK